MAFVWFARPDCRLCFLFSEIFEQRTETFLAFANNQRPIIGIA